MGWFGVYLFGNEDEIKVKQLQEVFNIKSYEKAKDIYVAIKNNLETE